MCEKERENEKRKLEKELVQFYTRFDCKKNFNKDFSDFEGCRNKIKSFDNKELLRKMDEVTKDLKTIISLNSHLSNCRGKFISYYQK